MCCIVLNEVLQDDTRSYYGGKVGLFFSGKEANGVLKKYKKIRGFKDYSEVFTHYLVIYDRSIGTLSWSEGFFTLHPE